MGLFLKTLLFAFLNFSVIHGKNLCPSSVCGNNMLSVKYPFKLENQKPTNNCTYVNLTCSTTHTTTTVNLPYAGDFYVQNIDYVGKYVQLYDPESCLMKRLRNFSLASSPLQAIYYSRYTFYVCPSDSMVLGSDYVDPIRCLSNDTNITTATRDLSREFMEGYGCISIGSWLIPVSSVADEYLLLTWDVNVCKDCQESGKWGGKTITKIIAIASSMPALMLMAFGCCSVFCLHITRMITGKHDVVSATSAAPTTTETPQITIATALPPPSTTTNTGLDESKIMACTEMVVLGESDQGIPSANSNTCSICLENYGKKETIRVISKCGHCFHDSCIQQWLGKNSTCPVCRTDVVL